MPLRRSRLVLSALIVGTMAPDLEYFVRLSPGGGWGHTIVGALGLSLPLGFAVLWLFHRFAKAPVVALLPDAFERRLATSLQPFPFLGLRRVMWIVLSLLVGIATHLAWDSFTHSHTWLYHHFGLLHRRVPVPLLHSMHVYTLLQVISDVVGIFIVIVWIRHWYRNTPPGPPPFRTIFTPGQKALVLATMLALSLAGGILRGLVHTRLPLTVANAPTMAGNVVVTVVALLWWQLVAWGMLMGRRIFQPVPEVEPLPH